VQEWPGDVVKTFKRTPLSSVFLFAAILFLFGWAGSMFRMGFIAIDLTFKLHRGSTPQSLLLWLIVTFGCYVAYLVSGMISRAVKYPRVRDGSNPLI
jgi:hypothetical protein